MLGQVQVRAQQNPDDADIQAAMVKLEARHQINVNRLETMIPVLDTLDLHSSEYKTVMLQHAGNISINFFSESALITVLKDSWAALKATLQENAPDLFFRFLLFMAILFVFRILSRLTKRVVGAASARSSLDMSDLLKNILVSTSGGTVMAIGVLMALSQVGISLAPMLAGLGVAGAMILIYRPFDVDDFVVRPWVKTGDYWNVYWDIMREVKLRFDREGISIPFPQRDVHLYTQKEE